MVSLGRVVPLLLPHEGSVMPLIRRNRSRSAPPLRAAVERFMTEELERRVMLSGSTTSTAPATLFASDPTADPIGPVQATLWLTPSSSEPIPTDGEVTPSVVNGVVYSDTGGGSSGYGAFAAASGLLGMEDYDSINNANITLTGFKFVGGGAAPGTYAFEFYNTSDVLVTSFNGNLP